MNYIKSNNKIFIEKNGKTTASLIGHESIYLYLFLYTKRNLNGEVTISIKQIKSEINIRGFTKNKAILDKLIILKNYKLILFDGDKFKLNDIIKIKIPETKQYEKIPINLINENINAIGSIGIAIIMLLAKLHNKEKGYCNPSYEYIAHMLGISKKTTTTYINKLEELGLLKREVSEIINTYDDEGIAMLTRYTNKYKLKYITDKRSRYYINKT